MRFGFRYVEKYVDKFGGSWFLLVGLVVDKLFWGNMGVGGELSVSLGCSFCSQCECVLPSRSNQISGVLIGFYYAPFILKIRILRNSKSCDIIVSQQRNTDNGERARTFQGLSAVVQLLQQNNVVLVDFIVFVHIATPDRIISVLCGKISPYTQVFIEKGIHRGAIASLKAYCRTCAVSVSKRV